jgi:hypothetical protein
MPGKIVDLPDDFIGKEDEARLESFGAHLIAHGWATRWHWNRDHGIDLAFELFRGGSDERLMLAIRRDRAKDAFYVCDADGGRVDEGKLEHVMAVADSMARTARRSGPA